MELPNIPSVHSRHSEEDFELPSNCLELHMTNGKQKIKQKALESLQQIIDGFLGNEEFPNESLLNDPDQELKKALKGIIF